VDKGAILTKVLFSGVFISDEASICVNETKVIKISNKVIKIILENPRIRDLLEEDEVN
jgi:hypothetical protein